MKTADFSLYAILDPRFLKARSLTDVALALIRGGATCLQLRDKEANSRMLYEEARLLKVALNPLRVPFIVNDRLDIALAVDADGVHLGEQDVPVPEARRIMGKDKLLGASADTIETAIRAARDGADYIGFGAVFPTGTKPDARLGGLSLLPEVKRAVSIPVVAIGGIKRSNALEVLRAGADGLAVISDLLEAGDVEARAREFSAIIKNYRFKG
jgi:thiamine-phosphate diphosphorylase